MIVLKHPATGGTMTCTVDEEAAAWETVGWQRLDASSATKDELLTIAREHHVDVDESMSKPQLAKALSSAGETDADAGTSGGEG